MFKIYCQYSLLRKVMRLKDRKLKMSRYKQKDELRNFLESPFISTTNKSKEELTPRKKILLHEISKHNSEMKSVKKTIKNERTEIAG